MLKLLGISVLITLGSYTNPVHAASTAADIQHISCSFANPDSMDRVVVSLKSPYKGTFFYTTGVDDMGESHDTGVIGIERVEDDKTHADEAKFLAKWMTVQDGSKITVEFHFIMPKEHVYKAADFFNASMSTEIIDYDGSKQLSRLHNKDELTCFARMYPAPAPKTSN
jgi:hypothetical protein